MNDWTPVLGETLSARPEPENEIGKYELIHWALLILLSQGKGLTVEMGKFCKFPVQSRSRGKKNILKF